MVCGDSCMFSVVICAYFVGVSARSGMAICKWFVAICLCSQRRIFWVASAHVS